MKGVGIESPRTQSTREVDLSRVVGGRNFRYLKRVEGINTESFEKDMNFFVEGEDRGIRNTTK